MAEYSVQVVERSVGRGIGRLSSVGRLEAWEWAFIAGLCGWLGLLVWRSLSLPPLDVGLAYTGGQAAWATGHPENVASWISTPFLALVMAVTSRLLTRGEASAAITLLNFALVGALLPSIWLPLRRRVSPLFWWLTITGAVVFAPLASTIFWRQFNLLALSLAVMGFWLSARRPVAAGALAALSIAIKPLVFLLPIAMLWKRETRKAGMWTLIWGTGLLAVSQVFLAWRAHSAGTFIPIAELKKIAGGDSRPGAAAPWLCDSQNFSPAATICRVVGGGGGHDWPAIQDLTLLGVGGIALIAVLLLRRTPGTSWFVFAFASLLSPMMGTIAWSHYQILMAPMLLLLAVDLYERRGGAIEWILLGSVFVLCELTWRPYGMIYNIAHQFVNGAQAAPTPFSHILLGFAQFAQYLLFFTAVVWLNRLSGGVPRNTPIGRSAR